MERHVSTHLSPTGPNYTLKRNSTTSPSFMM